MPDRPSKENQPEQGTHDTLGRIIHGARWNNVQTAQQQARERTTRKAERQARHDAIGQTIDTIQRAAVLLALIALLAATVVWAWKGAL